MAENRQLLERQLEQAKARGGLRQICEAQLAIEEFDRRCWNAEAEESRLLSLLALQSGGAGLAAAHALANRKKAELAIQRANGEAVGLGLGSVFGHARPQELHAPPPGSSPEMGGAGEGRRRAGGELERRNERRLLERQLEREREERAKEGVGGPGGVLYKDIDNIVRRGTEQYAPRPADERSAQAVLQQLAEMGFAGADADAALLRACDYDIALVLDRLFERGAAPAPCSTPPMPTAGAREVAELIMREQDISDRLLGDGPPVEVPTELVMRWTNNFSDERKIGEGAFGDVYEGILADSSNQRQAHVAVKRLKPEIRLQGDENEQRAAVSSIRREIHVLSAFRHPHIIRLLGFTSTSAGVAQELCLVYDLGYASLDKMLTDDEKAQELSCKVRIRIAADISRALNYLHCHDPRSPAFHRDVKSPNIVLTFALSPKLIDCGLSKFIPDQQRHGTIMSTRGAILGTPGYMCPKYARGGSEYDAKSENFSFGIVLLELLLGRLQGKGENDLFASCIEDETPVSVDMRAGPWIPACAEKLEMLARECLSPYGKRISTMMAVMRRLVELEKEFCRATAEEVRLTRLAEKMQRELEALRFEAATQADAREGEQKQCCICYDVLPVSAGLGCESSACHFICANCAPLEVQRILEAIQEAEPLARHRAQGGRIMCVLQGCEAPYAESALARVLPDALFREYRAAQNAVVEQRLFEELQQRFQEQLEAARREFENANNVARAEQGAAATAEFMRRQYPNAVQCPRCRAGPVIPENCYDLQAHHGESSNSGRGRISNACPSCGFFSRERGDWVRWDGQLR